MALSPLNSNTVFVVMVYGLIDFEKVNTTWVFSPTLVVPLAGEMVTVGGVLSTVFAVVNAPASLYARFPASSVRPYTYIRISVLAGYWVSGVNVTVAPLTLKLPATTAPMALT